MSSINWSEVLAIFVGFGAFFIYLMARLDNLKKELSDKIKSSEKELKMEIREQDKKIDSLQKELKMEIREQDKKIDSLQKDLNSIHSKISNIEGQITQMTRPNVIPIQRYQIDDEPKEN